MRKRRYFATAGEKRKFYNNLRYFGGTRQIAVACLGIVPVLMPVALVAICMFTLAAFATGIHSHREVAGLGLHGKQHLPAVLAFAVLATPREMREERGRIAQQMSDLADKRDKWTAEDRTTFDRMIEDEQRLMKDIERLETADRVAADIRAGGTHPPNPAIDQADIWKTAIPQYRKALIKHGIRAVEKLSPEARNVIEALNGQYFTALNDYLLKGENMSPESRAVLTGGRQEFRDMGVAVGSGGGFFVPQGFIYEVEEALKYYGPMLQAAEIMPTATGNPLPHPTDNDTTVEGELVGEGAQVSTQDITLGSITLNAYKFSTKLLKISVELLQDSAFDLETYLKKKFAIRLGRILNRKFTIGTGTGEPKGIVVASSVGVGTGGAFATIGDDNQNTPDPTQQVGYIDLTNLEHSVDPLYRPGAAWMMNDSTLRFIKTLKDKFGRPLWMPGLNTGQPDNILQYKYWINNHMSALATGNITVLFGQMDKYMIRQVKELSVMKLVERYADFGQVAFIGFARYDGNLIDAGTNPVKFLKQA